ncbi:unnamed protein product [Phytomonas sp. Hart1]|nr:unnamed protein product [Phytomonas sp. Hart1]|eukprot:CCW70231.1 unnamed protein product [Phytomonas sp. isolate Hart1]
MLAGALSGDSISSIWAMALISEQVFFMLYHYNSCANTSGALCETKASFLQKLFLTRANSSFPNPLSCFYVHTLRDGVLNTVASWLLVKPVTLVIGWPHSIFFFLGAGSLSSFVYLFSTQTSRLKPKTTNDYACASNGAFAGIATLSLILPKRYSPLFERTPLALIGALYLIKCTYDEYIKPMHPETHQERNINLRNRGFIGGVFFALMYSSLFLQTRTDFSMLRIFYKNIKKQQHSS